MSKLFDALIKIGVIATLIYGLLTEQHYYSEFLRWVVFVSSIYFAFKSKQVIGILGIRFSLIFFCAFALLFNPFIEFDFGETSSRIIDFISCVFIAITLDLKGYAKSLSPKGITPQLNKTGLINANDEIKPEVFKETLDQNDKI